MSDFSAFIKKKKGEEEKPDLKPEKEKKKATKEKSAEVVEEEKTEADTEASVEIEEDRREDYTETETEEPAAPEPSEKPSVPKPPKKGTVPRPPKPKETSAPSSSAPSPKPAAEPTPTEMYTAEDLHKAVLISNFGDSPDESTYGGKQSITVVADKGGGKSTIALAFSGKKLVITYDRMTEFNKYKMRDPEEIKIIDPMPLLDSATPLRKRNTYVKIFDYLVGVEEYPNGPRHGGLLDTHEPVDWVIHDGTDILMIICEMVMRFRNDLIPSQGVEWTLWKERKDAIQAVFNKSLTLARKGVIFTTYFTEKQLDEDITGQKKTKEMPKWMDIILYQTLHTFAAQAQGDNFFLFVHQSKSIKKDVTRKTYDVTGTPTEEVVDGETVYGMDFSKLYEVIEQIEREVF